MKIEGPRATRVKVALGVTTAAIAAGGTSARTYARVARDGTLMDQRGLAQISG